MTEESETYRLFLLAITLAREGLCTEAKKVLQKALENGECSEAQASDLRALIFAQEGLDSHAESCGQELQDPATAHPPASDRVRAQLRQSGRSRGRRSLRSAGLAIAVVVVLGFLLWQALFVNPKFEERLTSNEMSLALLREGLMEIKHSTQVGDQELSNSIMSLNSKLSALDQHLSERLVNLSTATKAIQGNAEAMARLNEKIEGLQKALENSIAGLDTIQTELSVQDDRLSLANRIVDISPQASQPGKPIAPSQRSVANSPRLGESVANDPPSAPIEDFPAATSRAPTRAPFPDSVRDAPLIHPEPSKGGRAPLELQEGFSPVAESSEENVPELQQLGISVQAQIPSMRLSMLVYSDLPKERMIVINGRTMQEGDAIGSDLKLERILPTGAIFKFRGWFFRKGFF